MSPSIDGSAVADRGHATDHSWWLYIAAGLVVMGVYFACPDEWFVVRADREGELVLFG